MPMEHLEAWAPLAFDVALIVSVLLASWGLAWLAFRGSIRLATRASRPLVAELLEEIRRGASLLVVVFAVREALLFLTRLPESALGTLRHGLLLLGIASFTLIGIGAVSAIARFIRSGHDVAAADNLEARRVYTQVGVLERTAAVLIVVLGAGFALLTFPAVREIGTGLLASAGVVGLIAGLAARPLLENLIAGIQLALTQPIRIDDVVIIHGEWGRIEEITTTYVVVRIWDERRLVVPFSDFLHEAFENWTRTSAEILGTVFLFVDYRLPVEEARAALEEIVHAAPLWDGRVCNVQVVDVTEQAIKLRALVSASDASRAWDLRVEVREKWVEWLQRVHPEALPRQRISMQD
jgi:small-conductance mechanosensitive channel